VSGALPTRHKPGGGARGETLKLIGILLMVCGAVILLVAVLRGKPQTPARQESPAEVVEEPADLGSGAATNSLVRLLSASTTPKSNAVTALQLAEPLPSYDEIIRQLNAEAQRQRVFYNVYCTAYYEGDEEKYDALATKGKHFCIYLEEGAEPYWSVSDYKSADEAAWALVQRLRQPPNFQPSQQRERKRRAAQCTPLSGGPQK
jgi:hypothetical protein